MNLVMFVVSQVTDAIFLEKFVIVFFGKTSGPRVGRIGFVVPEKFVIFPDNIVVRFVPRPQNIKCCCL